MEIKEFSLRYNPALDGLRGLAILLVILSHAHVPLFDGAFFGVDLFFVLSGFLITSLLLMEWKAHGQLDFWRFYRRRFYRLMPALLLFLGVYALAAPLLWPDLDDVYSDVVWSALYLADYGIAFFDRPGTLLHMWSLSVEEHFYLVWPVLLVFFLRRANSGAQSTGSVWKPLAALWVAATLWRVFWVGQEQAFYAIFFRFDTRASGLLAGALLAALVIEKPGFIQSLARRMRYALWLPLSIPLLMALAWDDYNALLWGMTVVELATVVVLVAVLPQVRQNGLVADMLSAPALVRLGQLSYGVYLWHYPVVRYLRADYSWPTVVVAGTVISLALAALSYYTVERWALKKRDGSATERKVKPTTVNA
ncbi:acyltransferase family protein [Ottowia thiooxydans]|uniref:Peptidoglycan/LPS O-acetylase OafA/YrhL n=1 Tax=Ottowia thiooxydans TaxID=219182 RepID=A0ABV2QH11_9BURK